MFVDKLMQFWFCKKRLKRSSYFFINKCIIIIMHYFQRCNKFNYISTKTNNTTIHREQITINQKNTLFIKKLMKNMSIFFSMITKLFKVHNKFQMSYFSNNLNATKYFTHHFIVAYWKCIILMHFYIKFFNA